MFIPRHQQSKQQSSNLPLMIEKREKKPTIILFEQRNHHSIRIQRCSILSLSLLPTLSTTKSFQLNHTVKQNQHVTGHGQAWRTPPSNRAGDSRSGSHQRGVTHPELCLDQHLCLQIPLELVVHQCAAAGCGDRRHLLGCCVWCCSLE